ncbi:hypothetical protein M747DRAFT_309240 [Aspergillus niger ATCC 13496]|uniref:Uncharacterized protein n=1 Tax=Aspergillus niger ATCC 13496 TaxID=1353008 RepID=A0A370BQC8_ASPNG|nr:hypothetical protein M747DRAFT_309240 [Aspergillus niger ATCC 13496]
MAPAKAFTTTNRFRELRRKASDLHNCVRQASLTTTQGITFSKTAVAIVFANYYGRHRSRQTFDDGLRVGVKGGRACYREITTDGGLRQLLQNASFCRIMSVDGTQPSGITQHKLPARTVA